MLFMVVERFKNRDAKAAYRHFRDKGRGTPEGLRYVDSWIVDDSGLDRCFQLMETGDPELLDVWRGRWADLCDFEVFPVIKSDEAARRTGVRWDTPGR